MVPQKRKTAFPTDHSPSLSRHNLQVVLTCCSVSLPLRLRQLRANSDKYTYGTTDGHGGSIHFGVTRVLKGLGVRARVIPFNSTPATLQGFLSASVDIYTGASAVAIKGSMGSGAAKCILVSSVQDNAPVPQTSGLDAMGAANAATYIL